MLRRILLLSATGLLFAGCQDYVFEQKCPETIKEQEITRAAAEPRPADILFIVDNSGSMADEQANLAANFNAFINEIAGPDNDYRIAVVTTDTSNGNEAQGLREDIFAVEPGTGVEALVAPDISGCSATQIPTSCFRGPNPDQRIIDSTTMDAATQIAAFKNNVQVGSCGSGDEEGLEAMKQALSKTNGCNAGFLRPDANLVIVIVSDEDDHSDDSVAQYIEDLKRVKSVSQTRVAVIVGAVDGDASNCAIDFGANCGSLCTGGGPQPSSGTTCNSQTAPTVCEDWEVCNGGMCSSEAFRQWNTPNNDACLSCSFFRAEDCCAALSGRGYVQFARQFETELNAADSSFQIYGCNAPAGERAACLIDSICQDSFATTLQRIARDLVIVDEYSLIPPALNPAGVQVRLVGGRYGEGVDLVADTDFTVNEAGTAVKLVGDKIPGPDEDIEIFYVSDKIDSSSNPRGACGI